MKGFQHKRGWSDILHSKPVLVFLACLLLIFAWGIFGFMGKMRETIENKNIAESKLTQLQKEKEQLSSDIAKLKTNEGVEASIRDKFGLAKEGEGVIIIVDDKNKEEPKKEDSGGFWFWFHNWFK